MSNENIISRIKKMMALANDSNASDGERDNAMRMAYATMAKYNIEEGDLSEKEVREILDYAGCNSPWARHVANAIAGLFFCKYYSQTGYKSFTHKFVGKPANAITAQLMTDYVIRSIRSESGKEKRKNGYPGSWITSFNKGAADTIADRCKELREAKCKEFSAGTGTALVLASVYASELEANLTFLEGVGIKLRSRASRERRAGFGYNDGKEFGKGISLNNQVGGGSGQLRIGK